MLLLLYVNLKRNSGSAQVSQLRQVTGQAAETPVRLQRSAVLVLLTHSQDLVIGVLAPSLNILSLRGLSLQDGSFVGSQVVCQVGSQVGSIVGPLQPPSLTVTEATSGAAPLVLREFTVIVLKIARVELKEDE